MNITERTIEFEELMDMVEYVDCKVNDIYTLKWEGVTQKFRDTSEIVPFVSRTGWIVTYDGIPMTEHDIREGYPMMNGIAYESDGIRVGDIVTVTEELKSFVGDSDVTCKIGERFKVKSIRIEDGRPTFYLSTFDFFSMPFKASAGQIEKWDIVAGRGTLLINAINRLKRDVTYPAGMVPCTVCKEQLVEEAAVQTANVNGHELEIDESESICDGCLEALNGKIRKMVDKLAIETRKVQS